MKLVSILEASNQHPYVDVHVFGDLPEEVLPKVETLAEDICDSYDHVQDDSWDNHLKTLRGVLKADGELALSLTHPDKAFILQHCHEWALRTLPALEDESLIDDWHRSMTLWMAALTSALAAWNRAGE